MRGFEASSNSVFDLDVSLCALPLLLHRGHSLTAEFVENRVVSSHHDAEIDRGGLPLHDIKL